jgi:hypothetical protein
MSRVVRFFLAIVIGLGVLLRVVPNTAFWASRALRQGLYDELYLAAGLVNPCASNQ